MLQRYEIPNNFQPRTSEKSVSSYVRRKFGKDLEPAENQSVTKASNPKIFLGMMSKNRNNSKKLYRHFSTHSQFKNSHVQKHLAKNCTCGTYGAFRELGSTGEMHKIGTSFCKSRSCTTCNSVLSKKRTDSYSNYLFENHKDKFFYHGVFTLKHNTNYRNFDYTKELVKSFKNLRESRYLLNGQEIRHFWKNNISGGFYNVEIKQSANGKHIHLHVILLADRYLGDDFTAGIKEAWKHITQDSEVVFLERIYNIKNGIKQYYSPKLPEEEKEDIFKKALPEALKYALKSDFETLKELGFEFLNQFLGNRKRLFSRFGCLYNVPELNIDFKNLDEIELTDNQLVSCKTGEIFERHETKIVVTKVSNAKIRTIKRIDIQIDFETGEITTGTINKYFWELNEGLNPEDINRFHHNDLRSVMKNLSQNQNKIWKQFKNSKMSLFS